MTNKTNTNHYASPLTDCKEDRGKRRLSELEENVIVTAVSTAVGLIPAGVYLSLNLSPELITVAKGYLGF